MKAVCLKFPAFLFAFLWIAFFSSSSLAHEEDSSAAAKRFRKKLDSILSHSCLRKKNFGVKFYSLDRQRSLYEFNNQRLFIPASNMKLITTAMALKELGLDYHFPTNIYHTGTLKDGVIHGDLYIKGYGDPKFVSEQMWLLVNQIRNAPIRKIEGNIIADDSFFDGKRRVSTWSKRFGPEAYNAPLGALSLNFNTVTVYAEPGSRPGKPPKIIIDPDTQYIRVRNKGTTLSRKRRGHLIINRVKHVGYDEITVDGGIPIHKPREQYFLSISDPAKYTVTVFGEFLQKEGIEVTGDLGFGEVPENAQLLLTHESEPLPVILQGLNKYSNNFTAEQIMKAIAAKRFGPPGTMDHSRAVVEEYMGSLGFSPKWYRIYDGSGLSRQNRLSPNHIVKVLESVYNDWSIYPEFFSALGIMGTDGSVKDRFNGVKDAQKVRVKTGTLNFTSALSGYLQSRDGERFAFSILMNDLKCSNGSAKRIQNAIIAEGLKFHRSDDHMKQSSVQTLDGENTVIEKSVSKVINK